jgi:hypothetical protein
MAQPARGHKSDIKPADAPAHPGRLTPGVATLIAWLVPGAAHVLQGELRKGVVFAVVLVGMFLIGLGFGGRLFSFDPGDPLVFLAAAAQWALGLPRLGAALLGAGSGTVVSATYEYGNTFLISGGLLNALIVLDARDLALGRRRR